MRLIVFLLIIGAVTVLPAFADDSSVSINIMSGSQAGQSCVSDKNCYEPSTITVAPKTLVVWTNMDSVQHTVTSGTSSENNTGAVFDSSTIDPGATYSFMFISPGTYDYFCSIHPWMTGEVIVENTANTNSATTPEFGPAAVLVMVASMFATISLTKNKLNFRS